MFLLSYVWGRFSLLFTNWILAISSRRGFRTWQKAKWVSQSKLHMGTDLVLLPPNHVLSRAVSSSILDRLFFTFLDEVQPSDWFNPGSLPKLDLSMHCALHVTEWNALQCVALFLILTDQCSPNGILPAGYSWPYHPVVQYFNHKHIAINTPYKLELGSENYLVSTEIWKRKIRNIISAFL